MHAAIAILLLWRGALLVENRERSEDRARPAMSWAVLPEIHSREAETPAAPIPAVTVPTVAPPSHELLKLDVLSLPGPLRGSLPAPLPRLLPKPVGIPDEVSGGSDKGSNCGGSREVVPSSDADADPAAPTPPLLPTTTAEGHVVQFWIRADGRVKKIAVSPPIRDSHDRRRLMEALGTFVFGRVRTPDGRPIAYVYSCFIYS